MNKTAKKKAISRISALHYAKLIFRSCLFLIASFIYVTDRVKGVPRPLERLDVPPAVMVFIWLVFIVEMIFRFFPRGSRVWAVRNSSAQTIYLPEKNLPLLSIPESRPIRR